MTIEDKFDEIKELALEMSRHYHKGFGNGIAGISSRAERGLRKNIIEEYRETAYVLFDPIENHYKNIPFESLKGKEEFYPLFIVRDLLPKFKAEMDKVFLTKEKEDALSLLYFSDAIHAVGAIYEENFRSLLKKIRATGETFPMEIVDARGNKFYF